MSNQSIIIVHVDVSSSMYNLVSIIFFSGNHHSMYYINQSIYIFPLNSFSLQNSIDDEKINSKY